MRSPRDASLHVYPHSCWYDVAARLSFALMVLSLFCIAARAKYGGGTGEPNDPYLIYTPAHLQAIGLDPDSWDKHFKLMSDLEMIPYQGPGESQTVKPIGLYSQRPFSGHFDGGGHTISHLIIRETDLGPVGLFGSVGPPLPSDFPWSNEAEAVEVIRDLGLIDPSVQSPSNIGVGALVGYLTSGKVSSCYVKGGIVKGANRAGGLVGSAPSHNVPTPHALCDCHVQGCDVRGDSLVGGLVGEFGDGRITACWSVAHVRGVQYVGGLAGMVEMLGEGDYLSICWSSGTVEGISDVGGLAGMWRGHGAITNCYSTAAIHGGSATGGLVGTNIYGSIVNCYSVAPVSGVSRVGGLVGVNQGAVNTCYAGGPVKGESQTGGLVGSLNADPLYADGSTTDSFWDVDTSGQTASAGGMGKTTWQMRQQSTFDNWDFIKVWDIAENQTYPFLRLFEGSRGNPYVKL